MTEQQHEQQDDAPGIEFETKAIPEHEVAAAANMLAPATGAGTAEAALAKIVELRGEEKAGFYGGYINGELVGAYGIRRDGMANTIAIIAVREDYRRKGIGRALLTDALYRSARRPLTAEADEEGVAFYKACGFKLVGRRVDPSGTVRFRLGWHAPSEHYENGPANLLSQRKRNPDPTVGES